MRHVNALMRDDSNNRRTVMAKKESGGKKKGGDKSKSPVREMTRQEKLIVLVRFNERVRMLEEFQTSINRDLEKARLIRGALLKQVKKNPVKV